MLEYFSRKPSKWFEKKSKERVEVLISTRRKKVVRKKQKFLGGVFNKKIIEKFTRYDQKNLPIIRAAVRINEKTCFS